MIKHTNRLGITYYLHRNTTGYHFSQDKAGFVAKMPEGWEIYEHPTGQVFLRRSQPSSWSQDEMTMIKDRMARLEYLDYAVHVHDKTATIWVGPKNDEIVETWYKHGFKDRQAAIASQRKQWEYRPLISYRKNRESYLALDGNEELDQGRLNTMLNLFCR